MVQLRISAAGYYPGDYQPAASGVVAKYYLGVVLMAVAGVLFVVAVMTFLMVCCLLVNGGDD